MSTAKTLLAALKKAERSRSTANPAYQRLPEIFPLRPISSKAEHALALKVLGKLTHYLRSENVADDGLEYYVGTLTKLIDDWSRKDETVPASRGARMVTSLLDHGLKPSDIASELGGLPVVSRILRGEEDLNTGQIRVLAARFKVPAGGQVK